MSSTTSPLPTSTALQFVQTSTLSGIDNEVYESVYVVTGCLYLLMGLVVLHSGLRRKTALSWPFVFFAGLNVIYYLAIGVADLANASGISSEWPLYLPPIAAMACFGGIVATFFSWTSNVHQVQAQPRPASWSGLTSGLLVFLALLFMTVQLFAINKIITMDTSQDAGNPTLLLTISGYGMDGLSLLYLLLVIVSSLSQMHKNCTKKGHIAILILIPLLFFISRAYTRIITVLHPSFGFIPMVIAGFVVASLPDFIFLALIAIYNISLFGRDPKKPKKVAVGGDNFEMIPTPPIVINHPKFAATRNSVIQTSEDEDTEDKTIFVDPQFGSIPALPRPTRPRPAVRRTDPVQNSQESLNGSEPQSSQQSPSASRTPSPRGPQSGSAARPSPSRNSQQASTTPRPRSQAPGPRPQSASPGPRPQSLSPAPRPQSLSPGPRPQSASAAPQAKSTAMQPYGHGTYPIQQQESAVAAYAQQQQQLYLQRQQQGNNGQLHPPSPSHAAQGYSASPGPEYRGSTGGSSRSSLKSSSQSTN